METTLALIENIHPNPDAKILYHSLIGIDKQKEALLLNLSLLIDKRKIEGWQKKNHPGGIDLLQLVGSTGALFILSGEVGCGKTALANSIATPLAEKLRTKIITMETPSNIRGYGRVGEISSRISSAFTTAKQRVGKDKMGLLIIDEADDLATSRSQKHAHHEDRAGLNVLIKQIDAISREKINLAVIMITNRMVVLDPAIKRRAALQLIFERPDVEARKKVFRLLMNKLTYTEQDMQNFIHETSTPSVPYSYSDLIQRAGKQALLKAIDLDVPFGPSLYMDVLREIKPTPLLREEE
jgi:SpoVK/Ycf46/Vps4 family AAA+-type ATPase